MKNITRLDAFKRYSAWATSTYSRTENVLKILDGEQYLYVVVNITGQDCEFELDIISQFEFDKYFSLEKL